MTSKTSEILMGEHKEILRVVDFLAQEADRLEKGKRVDEDILKKLVSFIRNYADKIHHAKEEDILFCEFETSCSHCNPVPQMLHEHELGRDFVKGIENGMKEKNKVKIIENMKGYASLLKEHIFKEDNILYPMAEDSINEKVKREMLAKFMELDKKKAKEIKENVNFARSLK